MNRSLNKLNGFALASGTRHRYREGNKAAERGKAFCLLCFIPALYLIFLSPAALYAQFESEQEALQYYLDIAINQNPGLQALDAEYQAILQRVPQAGALDDPEIEFEYYTYRRASASPMQSNLSVEIMQSFPWFGTLGANRRYYKDRAEAERMMSSHGQNEVTRGVKMLWFSMHKLKHHIHILNSNLDLLQSLEQQLLARLEVARGSQVDVLRVQIERDELKNRLEAYSDQLDANKIRFNNLLNRERDAEIQLFETIEERVPPAVPGGEASDMMAGNPNIRSLEFHEQAAQINVERARLDGLPSFGLGLMVGHRDLGFLDPGGINTIEAVVKIDLPIYRNRYRAQRAEAQQQVRAAQEFRREVVNRIESDLAEAGQNYTTSQREIELYRNRLIPTTHQALEIALTNFGFGGTGFEQIIQLQRQILTYEMALNEAVTERNNAVAEIEFLFGRN